jgi:hypothetical protein
VEHLAESQEPRPVARCVPAGLLTQMLVDIGYVWCRGAPVTLTSSPLQYYFHSLRANVH